MFASSGSAKSSVARLTNDIDELLSADLSRLGSGQLLALLTGLEAQVRRLAAVDHTLLAELDARGVAHERGCRNTEALLRQALRVGAGEARSRVAAARELGPRRGLTGEGLPPRFTQAAAAERAGVPSPAQARIITSTVDRLPTAVAAEHDVAVEGFLVEQAQTFAPEQLAKLAQRLTNTLDPDGVLADERYRERLRDLSVRVRADGSARVDGELTAACTEALLTVLDATAKPAPVADGAHDPRSPGQRRHDGLLDGLLTVLRTDRLPQANGVSTAILLTMTTDQLQQHLDGRPGGFVLTGHGTTMSLTQALQLAADARVVPVVFGRAKEVAAYGTGHRIFTEAQRLAIIARDHGCTFPRCDVAALWCQAHHAPEHAVSGRTTISEGTLVCGFHHREHQRLGWRTVMDGAIASWVPPPWLDPRQVPRCNTMHDPAIDAESAHPPTLVPG